MYSVSLHVEKSGNTKTWRPQFVQDMNKLPDFRYFHCILITAAPAANYESVIQSSSDPSHSFFENNNISSVSPFEPAKHLFIFLHIFITSLRV